MSFRNMGHYDVLLPMATVYEELTDAARTYLVKSSPFYWGHMMRVAVSEWQRDADGKWHCAPGDRPDERYVAEDRSSQVYHAMMLALRDYVNKNRFPGVVLGLSGGIDSALSAAARS